MSSHANPEAHFDHLMDAAMYTAAEARQIAGVISEDIAPASHSINNFKAGLSEPAVRRAWEQAANNSSQQATNQIGIMACRAALKK